MDADEVMGTTTQTIPEATRTGHESAATRATGAVESAAERAGDTLWVRLRHRPYVAVAIATGIGIAAADAIGVGEMAIGVLAGYALYQMLVRREPPSKAFRDAASLEKELIP